MRLTDLVKELNITKQQIVDKLKSFHIKAKDELSDYVAAILRTEFKKSAAKPITKPEEKPQEKAKEKAVEKLKENIAVAKKAVAKEKPALKTKNAAVEKKPKIIAKPTLKPATKVDARVVEKIKPQPEAKTIEKKVVLPPRAETKVAPKVEKPAPPKPFVKSSSQPAVKKIEVVKEKPQVEAVTPASEITKPAVILEEVQLDLPITVKDLAVKLQIKSSVILKQLLDSKIFVNINQSLNEDTVNKIANTFGYAITKLPSQEEMMVEIHEKEDVDKALLQHRPPVVTFMGHVDHGKTSLLDIIRKTSVAQREHGGITQHIGAYSLKVKNGIITFLDTPGHEAFTAMRARGANITDIVVLVVAADEGIMPQTVEAIDHARAANVPILVALNKIDKSSADPDRVKKQLAELDLMAEDWGGKTIVVGVSAKTGQGIDSLLEMILLEAEILELKANPDKSASGVIVDAKLSKGKGPVATIIVQNGTLHLNDTIVAGNYSGKVRAMFNDRQSVLTFVGPATPAEILGLSGVPEAGEKFYVIKDEKTAREIMLKRHEIARQTRMQPIARVSLEDISAQIKDGKSIKELRIILKADVQGSLEALLDSLKKIPSTEVQLLVIHNAIGSINTSDVILAAASNAVIIGFHVEMDEPAKEQAVKEGVDVRTYRIIYDAINEIRAALEGMLAPKLKKIFMGKVEIRQMFKLTKSGQVAGCFVVKGKINRTAQLEVVRNGEVVFEGKLGSLKRFKDDVKEVAEGFECGLTIAGFDSVMAGDIVEAFEIEKIARKLE
ncbi:MAG: translation initiation factor IF-2 [Candidatus Omnitrophota bacterium]|nr:translation initiation factor IF-2 [Candidatus Omnitrophota bacterium]